MKNSRDRDVTLWFQETIASRWVHIWQSLCTYRKLLCIYNLDNWGVRSTRRWEERRNLNIPVLNDSFCTCSWVRFPPCGKLAAEVFPSSAFDSQFNDLNYAQNCKARKVKIGNLHLWAQDSLGHASVVWLWPTITMANTLKRQRQRRNDKDFTTKNIATGETSPAITPYHFLGNFNFSNFHH